jgi:hypothetical protein
VAHKSDKITYNQRVEIVYRMILDGWTAPQIVENAIKTWGIRQAQGYGYVKTAYTRIRKDADAYRKTALAEHIQARRQIRKVAPDSRTKLDALKDEAKLLGLYPADTAKVLNIDVTKLNDEQLERISHGEDPFIVAATPGKSGAGAAPAAGPGQATEPAGPVS